MPLLQLHDKKWLENAGNTRVAVTLVGLCDLDEVWEEQGHSQFSDKAL